MERPRRDVGAIQSAVTARDRDSARNTVLRGTFIAIAMSRMVRPCRRSARTFSRSSSVNLDGRPHLPPSASTRSRAALMRSLMAARSPCRP